MEEKEEEEEEEEAGQQERSRSSSRSPNEIVKCGNTEEGHYSLTWLTIFLFLLQTMSISLMETKMRRLTFEKKETSVPQVHDMKNPKRN